MCRYRYCYSQKPSATANVNAIAITTSELDARQNNPHQKQVRV